MANATSEPPLRILHVEDNNLDAILFEEVLSRAGVSLAIARAVSRADLVAALGGDPPDLVVSDYRLPGFNAFDTIAIVRQRHPAVPVVVMSGWDEASDIARLLAAGASHYIAKDRMADLVPILRGLATVRAGR